MTKFCLDQYRFCITFWSSKRIKPREYVNIEKQMQSAIRSSLANPSFLHIPKYFYWSKNNKHPANAPWFQRVCLAFWMAYSPWHVLETYTHTHIYIYYYILYIIYYILYLYLLCGSIVFFAVFSSFGKCLHQVLDPKKYRSTHFICPSWTRPSWRAPWQQGTNSLNLA